MKRLSLFVILIIYVFVVYGNDNFSLNEVFGDNTSFSGKAEVTVKMLNKEQIQEAQIYSITANGDTLSDVNYLVETIDDNGVKNSYVYYNGIYVMQAGNRTRRFNSTDNLKMFEDRNVRGRIIKGVHKTGLHSLLVPMFVKELVLDLIESGSSNCKYIRDSVYNGKDVSILQVNEILNNVVVRKMQFITEKISKNPVVYNIITSPGAIGQMEIEMKFNSVDKIFNEENMLLVVKSLLNE